MKFQNPILSFGRTHGRTGRTSPTQYAPSTFQKLGNKKDDKSLLKDVYYYVILLSICIS